MKKTLLLLTLFVTFSFYGAKPKKPSVQNNEIKILELVLTNLKSKHVVSKKIDNDFSKKMFKTYLDSLDRNRLFFLQSDIDEFKKYETKLDDQINNSDLSFFYLTRDRLMIRMKEGKEIYTNILKNGFDFSKKEVRMDFPYYTNATIANYGYVKNKAEARNRWNNFLKLIIIHESKTHFLKNRDLYISPKVFEDQVLNVSTIIGERLESTTLNHTDLSRDILFEYYMNSIIVQYDQHSKYYSPYTRDKYQFKESGKVEGCGITMRQGTDFVEVKKLIEGGPAWKSKKFEVGDAVLKIQQEDEEPENVVGYKAFAIAKLLKGKSGTTVKITTKKPNGSQETISIKREIVSTNDSFIKSSLVIKNDVKYAVIGFPRFYVDYDDDMVRNVADDFAKELDNLKLADVQGIVIDMRNNGGGSVEAVIEILGNFLNKKTVVQFKNKENAITFFETKNSEPKWNKNIVLLVNDQTASASEILTAAFKEYNLGITIGTQTYGKGTVQEFVDLNMFNAKKDDKEDFGMLKITVNKFYKCNGKSVQKTGILPDVNFSKANNLERESALKDAMIPDQVKDLKITSINDPSMFASIILASQKRVNDNKKNIYTAANKNFANELFDFKILNPAKVNDEIKRLSDKYKIESATVLSDLEFTPTANDQKLFKRKQYILNERSKWYAQLKADFQIEEGLTILSEMDGLKK